jgi:uncharacterized membrane-anchored protein
MNPSDQIVVSAPMSFAGSAQRAWKLTVYPHGNGWNTTVRAATITGVLLLITAWWAAVLCWYCVFGLWLIPYRLIRRGQRKEHRRALQHGETLAAIRGRDG